MLRRSRAQPAEPDAAAALREIFGDYELPTFPKVVMSAIERISSADADLMEVAEILKGDPGLSVRLLRLVNSATFAPRRPIVDLPQAVLMLGRNQLESLLISLATQRALPREEVHGFDMGEFWIRAARRASVAGAFANLLDPNRRSENFTAALIHDMALPVLIRREPRYGAVLERWRAGDAQLHEIERDEFGWDHAMVGGWMCESWEFPAMLTEAVAGHHDEPEPSDILPLVKVVAMSRDFEDEPRRERFLEYVTDVYGVPADLATTTFEKALSEASSTAALFG